MAQTYAVTVVNVNGVNKYRLDGDLTPALNLLRGFVYIFDQSDSSNNGHPLRFKDANGDSYSTGVVVNGTPGQSGATVTLTISTDSKGWSRQGWNTGGWNLDANEVARYYCTSHGNAMGNTVTLADFTASMSTVLYDGWSRQGWNTGGWNAGIVIPFATGAVGATTVDGEGDIAVSGVAATGAVGAVAAAATSTITLTGLAATGGVGAAVVKLPDVNLSVTGVSGTSAVGSTTVTGTASISVTGVSGTGELGLIQQPWGEIIPSQTPSWTTIAA